MIFGRRIYALHLKKKFEKYSKEIEVDKETGGYVSVEKIDIEVEYKIWFKYAE